MRKTNRTLFYIWLALLAIVRLIHPERVMDVLEFGGIIVVAVGVAWLLQPSDVGERVDGVLEFDLEHDPDTVLPGCIRTDD